VLGAFLSVWYLEAALVLLLSAAAKMRKPDSAGRALRRLRLPSSTASVRLLGGLEAGLAATCLIRPGRALPIVLACLYAIFGIFVLSLLRDKSSESCGCFGGVQSPPTWAHAIANLSTSLGILLAATTHNTPALPPPDMAWGSEFGLVVALGLITLGVWIVQSSAAPVLRKARPFLKGVQLGQ
jgi:hypothetical protein